MRNSEEISALRLSSRKFRDSPRIAGHAAYQLPAIRPRAAGRTCPRGCADQSLSAGRRKPDTSSTNHYTGPDRKSSLTVVIPHGIIDSRRLFRPFCACQLIITAIVFRPHYRMPMDLSFRMRALSSCAVSSTCAMRTFESSVYWKAAWEERNLLCDLTRCRAVTHVASCK